MPSNCKFLAIGGQESNLYLYNMEDNDFDQCPDVSDLTTGISDMDWDKSNETRIATIDTKGVLTIHTRNIVKEAEFNFDELSEQRAVYNSQRYDRFGRSDSIESHDEEEKENDQRGIGEESTQDIDGINFNVMT